MKRMLFSQAGKSFSAIGLGCVTFGREIDSAASFAIMDYAKAKGIRFFDTAQAYGAGASEKVVGKWLSNRKAIHSVKVATKIKPPYDPERIVEGVDQSLRNLGVGTINLLYLHCWDPSIENPISLKTLQGLKTAGKIQSIGVSNFRAAQLNNILQQQTALGLDLLQSVQNNNNYAVRETDKDLIQTCEKHEVPIVTYSPLGAGFLTGKYQNGVKENTRFDRIKGHQDIYFTKTAFDRLAQLQHIAASTGYSTSYLALAWALHQPGISSVLIGCRNIAQLGQALAASDFYDPAIFKEMEW